LLLKRFSSQVLLNTTGQRLVYQIVYLSVNPFPRDEDLFEQRQLLVVVINFSFDQCPDLFSGVLTGGNIGELMNDRWDLAIDAVFDKGDLVGRKGFRKCRIRAGEVVEPSGNKLSHLLLETLMGQ